MIRRAALTAALAAALATTTAVVSGCGSDPVPADPAMVIGSKGFTESRVVAAAYAEALRRVGFRPVVRTVGGTPILARALRSGRVDLYPEYTGSAWVALEGEDPTRLAGRGPAVQEVTVRTRLAADRALHAFAPAPASNNVVAACTRASGFRSLTDLATSTTPLRLAAEAETFSRADGLPWVQRAYGFTVSRQVVTPPGDRYGAIRNGEANCVAAYATDPEIESLHLVVLADPKRVLGGGIDYRPIALANAAWWDGLGEGVQARVDQALENVSHKLTTAWLRTANLRVVRGGESPEDVALELVNVTVPGRVAAPG